jgi:hypothetical protein
MLSRLKKLALWQRVKPQHYNELIDRVNALSNIKLSGNGTKSSIGPDGINLIVNGLNGSEIFFGKPVSAHSTGATISLDPCDNSGTDNGKANVTAYVQSSKASFTLANSASISTAAVCPYVKNTSDSYYYLLGNPLEIVTDVDVNTATMTKTVCNAWVMTQGGTATVTIDTFTTSCP